LSPLLVDRGIGAPMVLTGTRADTELFGAPPDQVLDRDAAIRPVRSILVGWLSALLIGVACLEIAVTWFGLRRGATWALVALVVQGLAMLPVYYLSYAPYRAAGVMIRLGEMPPFQWVPAALLVPATILGWIGVRAAA
jgi:hypothetical protein